MTKHSTDYLIIKAEIKNHLLSLGKSKEKIAEKLQSLSITGRLNDDTVGPISKYLNNALLDHWFQNVLVRYDSGINHTLEVKIGQELFVFWDLDEVVWFLYYFDNERYPELIDPTFKEQIQNCMAL